LPACPGGGVLNLITRKCYYVKTQANGWIEARDACRAEGFELVTIENAAESGFVFGMLSAAAWIGFNDIDIEGTFVWSDGSQSEYTKWDSGQPDDGNQEDCVEMRWRCAVPYRTLLLGIVGSKRNSMVMAGGFHLALSASAGIGQEACPPF
ncbi:unnamed protein product, partial [Cyprideis torosa]